MFFRSSIVAWHRPIARTLWKLLWNQHNSTRTKVKENTVAVSNTTILPHNGSFHDYSFSQSFRHVFWNNYIITQFLKTTLKHCTQNHVLSSQNWFFPPKQHSCIQLFKNSILLKSLIGCNCMVHTALKLLPYCNTILWIYHINIALTQSYQNRIQWIFVYPMG